MIRTTRRLLRRGGRDRLIWLVNLALIIAMTLCIASGILISRVALSELGISTPGGPFWSQLHTETATVTLVLVAVHVALRWRWIVTVGRRLFRRPTAGPKKPRPARNVLKSRPTPAARNVSGTLRPYGGLIPLTSVPK